MIEILKKVDNYFINQKTNVRYESPLEYLTSEVLHLCGCGNPEEVLLYIRDLLQQMDRKEWNSYDDLPYMFFVYWANHEEYLEHGSTARCSWLTDKGRELLRDIKLCEQYIEED